MKEMKNYVEGVICRHRQSSDNQTALAYSSPSQRKRRTIAFGSLNKSTYYHITDGIFLETARGITGKLCGVDELEKFK